MIESPIAICGGGMAALAAAAEVFADGIVAKQAEGGPAAGGEQLPEQASLSGAGGPAAGEEGGSAGEGREKGGEEGERER